MSVGPCINLVDSSLPDSTRNDFKITKNPFSTPVNIDINHVIKCSSPTIFFYSYCILAIKKCVVVRSGNKTSWYAQLSIDIAQKLYQL